MKNAFFLFIVVFCLHVFHAGAQNSKALHYDSIDKKISVFIKNFPQSKLGEISDFVNSNFLNSEDKVRAYYVWIIENIQFDNYYRGSSSVALILNLNSFK